MAGYSNRTPGGISLNHRLKILHVVGARPNFMKVAPVMRALEQSGKNEQLIVRTG